MNCADGKEQQIIFQQFIYKIIWGRLTSDSVFAAQQAARPHSCGLTRLPQLFGNQQENPRQKALDQNLAIRLVKALKVCAGEKGKEPRGFSNVCYGDGFFIFKSS